MIKKNIKGIKTTKSALHKILKGILHTEEEDKHNQENMGKTRHQRFTMPIILVN
jgi:hypothetical protein